MRGTLRETPRNPGTQPWAPRFPLKKHAEKLGRETWAFYPPKHPGQGVGVSFETPVKLRRQ